MRGNFTGITQDLNQTAGSFQYMPNPPRLGVHNERP